MKSFLENDENDWVLTHGDHLDHYRRVWMSVYCDPDTAGITEVPARHSSLSFADLIPDHRDYFDLPESRSDRTLASRIDDFCSRPDADPADRVCVEWYHRMDLEQDPLQLMPRSAYARVIEEWLEFLRRRQLSSIPCSDTTPRSMSSCSSGWTNKNRGDAGKAYPETTSPVNLNPHFHTRLREMIEETLARGKEKTHLLLYTMCSNSETFHKVMTGDESFVVRAALRGKFSVHSCARLRDIGQEKCFEIVGRFILAVENYLLHVYGNKTHPEYENLSHIEAKCPGL